MMTIIGIRADKHKIDIEGLEADVTKFMTSDPRQISRIEIAFRLTHTNATEEQLVLLKDAALHCPVALSLHPDIQQEVSFNF